MKTQQNQHDKLSIVIVDSGMGGLSICADIANEFKDRRSFGQVDLTYFNAWPEQNRGYNSLPDTAERIRVFNAALVAIEKLNPDLILIACNTLSILYPQTPFAGTTDVPVVGIVDFGVQMVYEHMVATPDSQAIILGTLTTVTSETHKKGLIEKGIAPERIIGQPCDQLATRIESGPGEEAVGQMMDGFLTEAAAKIDRNDAPVYAVFCCTHFEYAWDLFDHWLGHHIGDNVTILNPNTAMSSYVLDQYPEGRVAETNVTLTVLSRITWHDNKVIAIAEALSTVSPLTAEALKNYRQDPELFTF